MKTMYAEMMLHVRIQGMTVSGKQTKKHAMCDIVILGKQNCWVSIIFVRLLLKAAPERDIQDSLVSRERLLKQKLRNGGLP